MDREFPAVADDGQRHGAVGGDMLNFISETHAQVVAELDHALVVDRCVADFGDDIPLLHADKPDHRLNRACGRPCHEQPGRSLRNERRAGFSSVCNASNMRRLAVVMTVGDVLKEQVDLLAGNDVADVVGVIEAAEGQADHLVADHGRPAAVARIDGRVDLDAQAGNAENYTA